MLLSLAILAASLGYSTPRDDAKITLSAPAVAAPVLVAKVAALSGRTLDVSRELNLEQLVVKVNGVPVDTLLQKIADVSHAQWEPVGNGLRLTRTPTITNSLAAEEHEHILQGLRTEITRRLGVIKTAAIDEAAIKKQVQKVREYYELVGKRRGDYGEAGRPRLDWSGVMKIQQSNPGVAALLKLTSTIDLSSLSKLEMGEGMVFSSRPTQVQRSFGAGSAQILSEYNQSQAAWTQTIDRLIGSPSPKREPTSTVVVFAQVSNRQPGRINLSLSMFAISEKGESIGGVEGYELSSYPSEEGVAKAPDVAKDGTFPFSPECVAMYTYLESQKNAEREDDTVETPTIPPTDQQREFFTHPETFSLLQYRPSEALFAWADRQQANLVADLPDTASVETGISDVKEGSYGFAKYDLTEEQEWVVKDGWMTLTPRWPISTTSDRVDRKILGEATRMLMTGKPVDLDTTAYYNDRIGDLGTVLWENPLLRTNVSLGAMGSAFSFESAGESDMAWGFRFLTGLSASQRKLLAAGNKLPLQSLSMAETNLIRSQLYGTGSPFIIETGGDETEDVIDTPVAGSEVMDMMASRLHEFFDGRAYGEFTNEASFLLGRGIPNGTFVSMQVDPSYAFIGISKALPKGRLVGIDELAYRMSAAGKAETDLGPMPETFRVGRTTRYVMSIYFSEKRYIMSAVTETLIDPRSPAVPYASLPADVRAKIAEMSKSFDRDREAPPGSPPTRQFRALP